MKVKTIDENAIAVTAEESDDLLSIRRIIKEKDKVTGSTTRVIKQEKDFARPDRGERIRITIMLQVEKISLDNVLDKLRIQGTILESSSELVPNGSHHSMLVEINHSITITKKRWNSTERKLLKSNSEGTGFILVAIDNTGCGIGKLKGTHLDIMTDLGSGYSGKRYRGNFEITDFFRDVAGAVSTIAKDGHPIIIFGPGETRKKFLNYMLKTPLGQKCDIKTIEGIDSAGEDGIYMFTKSDVMKEVISGSKLAQVCSIIDEIMIMVNKGGHKFTMGYSDTKKANEFGAIDSVVFSEKMIQEIDEQEFVDFLNKLEANGVKTFGVDPSTDIGLRVAGLGGIVSILRFAIN